MLLTLKIWGHRPYGYRMDQRAVYNSGWSQIGLGSNSLGVGGCERRWCDWGYGGLHTIKVLKLLFEGLEPRKSGNEFLNNTSDSAAKDVLS